MKEEGFTLIELLGVVIILSIIALISVPIVLHLIEKSKEGAIRDSAIAYLDALEYYELKNGTLEENEKVELTKLNVKNSGKLEGYIVKEKGEIKIYLRDQKYCVVGNRNQLSKVVKKEQCKDFEQIKDWQAQLSIVRQEGENIDIKVETTSPLGIEKYEYQIDEGSYQVGTNTYTYQNVQGGEHVLTARITDYAGVTKIVKTSISLPTAITITNVPTQIFYVGDTYQLQTEISPKNSYNQKLIWTSSDPNVFSVDEKGLVTTKTFAKTALITVKTSNGKSASVEFRGGSGCVGAKTLVYTAQGLKTIDQLVVGEEVYTYNFEKRKVELKPIQQIFVHEEKNPLLQIQIGKDTIHITPNHNVYVENRGFIPARILRIGDSVITAHSIQGKVMRIETIQEDEKVYNLHIEQNHNFYVGEGHYLIHNAVFGSS